MQGYFSHCTKKRAVEDFEARCTKVRCTGRPEAIDRTSGTYRFWISRIVLQTVTSLQEPI